MNDIIIEITEQQHKRFLYLMFVYLFIYLFTHSARVRQKTHGDRQTDSHSSKFLCLGIGHFYTETKTLFCCYQLIRNARRVRLKVVVISVYDKGERKGEILN